MDVPLISVIIPVYNVEEYIEHCIKNILLQTYTNIEVIMVVLMIVSLLQKKLQKMTLVLFILIRKMVDSRTPEMQV